jgi:hypothetical protein
MAYQQAMTTMGKCRVTQQHNPTQLNVGGTHTPTQSILLEKVPVPF